MPRQYAMSEGEVLTAARLHLHEGWSLRSVSLKLRHPESTIYTSLKRAAYYVRPQSVASSEAGLLSTLGPDPDPALKKWPVKRHHVYRGSKT